MKLLSRQFVHKIKPQPAIQRDGRIRVSRTNDSITTLDKYVVIPMNVEGVEAVIKAWLMNIEVYDLLLGMDWIGQITPACSIPGPLYVLLVVDYFLRFSWAKGYLKHIEDEVIDIYENYISPIFGHSEAVYSDNSSHFVNQKVQDYSQERGVTHFTGPMSYPLSTGLLEPTVQSMMSYPRGRCIERGSTGAWSMDIREGVVFANTKSQKIHSYAPAKLMLGFSPHMNHFDVEWDRLKISPSI